MNFQSIFNNNLAGFEKRITIRLKKYWDFLCNERPFPKENEVNPKDLEDIWSNCFIVKANNSFKKEDYQYKYLGTNIIKAYGADFTGRKVTAIAAPEAGHLAEAYEHVLAYKRPVTDEGEIHISKNETVKYRQILLPLGDDGVNITAILGGMSYKVVKNEKRPFFLRFTGKE